LTGFLSTRFCFFDDCSCWISLHSTHPCPCDMCRFFSTCWQLQNQQSFDPISRKNGQTGRRSIGRRCRTKNSISPVSLQSISS
jgi:hypothetical protein